MRSLLHFLTIGPRLAPEIFQDPHIRNPLGVSLGAIAGALSRYYLSVWISQWLGIVFPYATLVVNLSGSYLMGLITTLILERALPLAPEIRLLVTVGFIGSFTTFSTYELDTLHLLEEGSLLRAGLYWIGSAVSGGIFLYLGMITARLLR